MLRFSAFLIALSAGLVSGLLRKRDSRSGLSWPWTMCAVFALAAIAFAAQVAFPPLLDWFSRDPLLLRGGQVWRAVTPLFFQDGGLPGAIFNLTILLLLGAVAENCFGPRRWLAIYFGGGIISEFLALAWQPHGAGNSIACFALAGAMTATGVRRKWGSIWLGLPLAGLGAGVALLVMQDIHGLAYWSGAVIGAGFLVREQGDG